ncbi:hypothetical protein PIB30_003552 [Stylosanthes scabra]|uniref:Zinc knuckle CX2CX4HX4C domain-containing protein n=1 Tax=Stylosanthes scabra TaxID=79078 RepID=A0ABU6X0T8_9FABA|nr:hypothetical protein [Stylosanthes scabra]
MASSAANPLDLNHSPSVDEEPVIVLDQSVIHGGIDRCSKSLIGRLLADRSFSVGTIEAALQSIWRQPDGFKVIDHGEHYKISELGLKLDTHFGEILDTDLFQVRGKENNIVKAKIRLDITKPLRRSLKISGPNNKLLHINLKYERIDTFCNYCGHIGHECRSCSFRLRIPSTMWFRKKNGVIG